MRRLNWRCAQRTLFRYFTNKINKRREKQIQSAQNLNFPFKIGIFFPYSMCLLVHTIFTDSYFDLFRSNLLLLRQIHCNLFNVLLLFYFVFAFRRITFFLAEANLFIKRAISTLWLTLATIYCRYLNCHVKFI